MKEYVSPFEEKHPNIMIDFNIYTLHELQEHTDSLDLIFSNNLEAEYLSNYTQVILDLLPIYLALSKKHPLAMRSSITVQEIQNEKFLIFPPHISSSALSHAQEAFLKYQVSPNFIPVENLSSQFLKICQNKGVCITSHYAVKGFEHDIALVKVKDFPLELNRIMAYQKRKLSKAGKAFCEYIMEQFS